MKKFSIITPSYNQAKFLEETILSVINQSYSNVEYIIIDGGSTDGSAEIIKKYEKHLAYWVSEKDSGQSEAINKGLKHASGDYITWLNSDDYFNPGTFAAVAALFEQNPDVHIVHGKARLFGNISRPSMIGLSETLPAHEYLPYMRFPQPSCFLKKEVLDACGGISDHLHYAMDFELIVKAVLLDLKLKNIDAVLSNYRLHDASKSNHDMKFLTEWSQVVGNIFYSLPNGRVFLDKLLQLGLCTNQGFEKYPVKIGLTYGKLEEVMLVHMHLHYHYNYRQLNTQVCKKISAFLQQNYPGFYADKFFRKYDLRLRFIPKFAFNLLRQ